MKQVTVVVIGLMLFVAAYAAATMGRDDLMRKVYKYDKSTYDRIEVIVEYENTLLVEFDQGGRNCHESWSLQDGEIVGKYNKTCKNH